MALTFKQGNTAVREQRLDEFGLLFRPLRALASKQEELPGSNATRAPPSLVASLFLRPQLPRNRVRSCRTAPWPERRSPKLLQRSGVETHFG